MNRDPLKFVFLGLSITSSWGNGHATTYRGLIRGLAARGHQVLFLERDAPSYASTRDLQEMPEARIELYRDLQQLRDEFTEEIREADAVVVGSHVPEGTAVGDWVLETTEGVPIFYDLDTPMTLSKVKRGQADYLAASQIPRYPLYLSFTGGPTLERLMKEFGSPKARPLHGLVDPDHFFPEPTEKKWDLGFLGTFSADRQAALQQLLVLPASQWSPGRFVVVGPQYPRDLHWPANVERIEHLAPADHRRFYNQQLFALNLTRGEMAAAGYSPGVRLFEAAACGIPIISDVWEGLDEIFELGDEMMVARTPEDVLHFLRGIPRDEQQEIGENARRRVLSSHTPSHRAAELEGYVAEALGHGVMEPHPELTPEPGREPVAHL